MARKVFEKAGMIPGLQAGIRPAVDPAPTNILLKPRTAPGTMMGFLTAQSSAVQEADALRQRVQQLQEEGPYRVLDPLQVRVSKWANRHDASFATPEFEELKTELAAAGGNIQPVKVRPVAAQGGATATAGREEFELVFGHRRHRGCLELGLPLLCLVEDVSDAVLFEQMDRENRHRKNLSPWEQGTMYRRALDEGLFPSLRKLAEALGVDVSAVSKSVTMARLPATVVAAFPSPLDIQFRWAAPLTDAVQKDAEAVLARAKRLSEHTPRPSAAAVFNELIGAGSDAVATAKASVAIRRGGKRAAVVTVDAKGKTVVTFEAGVVPADKRGELAKVLERWLEGTDKS